MDKKSSGEAATEIEPKTADFGGDGKALIGKKIRKRDMPGSVEDYNPKSKIYKVRFEADHTDEIKWDELKNYMPQEISFKRFPQKKKEPSVDPQEKEVEQSEKSEGLTHSDKSPKSLGAESDSEDGACSPMDEDSKGNESPVQETKKATRIQRATHENDIVITQVELKKTAKMDLLADVIVQNKLGKVPGKRTRKLNAISKDDEVSSGEEGDEEGDDDESSEEESLDGESLDEDDEDGDEDGDESEDESEEDDDDDGQDDDLELDTENEVGGEEPEWSDCSLNESDLERLRKKPKKKRKHVLTLQRWRGYKKKRRLKKQQENGEENKGEVKRQKKPKKPMDDLTRRRQAIAAELRRKLKDSAMKKKKKKKEAAVEKEALLEQAPPDQAPTVEAATEIVAVPISPVAEPQNDPKVVKASSPDPEEVKANSPGPQAITPDPKVVKTITPDPKVVKTITPIATVTDSESKPSPFDRGIKLRGRKLRKKFNGRIFRGEVADYDRRNRRYKIRYEDGDEEQLMWKDVGPLLVPFEELHSWDDPNYDSQPKRVISSELLEVEKKAKEEKMKLPKLKPQVVKKRH